MPTHSPPIRVPHMPLQSKTMKLRTLATNMSIAVALIPFTGCALLFWGQAKKDQEAAEARGEAMRDRRVEETRARMPDRRTDMYVVESGGS